MTTETNPHSQRTQNPGRWWDDALADRLFALPNASERPSRAASRSPVLVLGDHVEPGPRDADELDVVVSLARESYRSADGRERCALMGRAVSAITE